MVVQDDDLFDHLISSRLVDTFTGICLQDWASYVPCDYYSVSHVPGEIECFLCGLTGL